MNYRTYLLAGIHLFAVIFIPVSSWATTDNSPVIVVENFHDALLASMKSAYNTSVKQRFTVLEPVILQTFHSELMIKVASGSYWRKASKAQQDSLITAFSEFSIATYAAQFDGYSGQSFETLGQKPGLKKDILVTTQIIDPKSQNVALTYVTREKKGRWRIIDVLVDTGISNLARMRSEYRQILKSNGVDGLTNVLNLKTKSLLAN